MLPAPTIEPVDFDAAATEAVLRACLAESAELHWRVAGACMQPRLPDGAGLVLAAAHRRPPRFGDVVLVRQAAGLRLHRLVWPLVRVRAGGACGRVRTMADRARALDPAATPRDVLAVVTRVQRDHRWRNVRAPWTSARLLLRALSTSLTTRLLAASARAGASLPWRGHRRPA